MKKKILGITEYGFKYHDVRKHFFRNGYKVVNVFKNEKHAEKKGYLPCKICIK